MREHQDQMLMARERDKILQAKERWRDNKLWTVREHKDYNIYNNIYCNVFYYNFR